MSLHSGVVLYAAYVTSTLNSVSGRLTLYPDGHPDSGNLYSRFPWTTSRLLWTSEDNWNVMEDNAGQVRRTQSLR
jgi:hypothetical protein